MDVRDVIRLRQLQRFPQMQPPLPKPRSTPARPAYNTSSVQPISSPSPLELPLPELLSPELPLSELPLSELLPPELPLSELPLSELPPIAGCAVGTGVAIGAVTVVATFVGFVCCIEIGRAHV